MSRSGTISSAVLIAIVMLATPSGATPANDNFADAAIIDQLPFERSVDTTGATDEEFEGSLDTGCNQHPGIWVRYTPASDVTVIAVIDGAQRAAAALFEGESTDSLRFIYCMRSLDGRPGSSDGNLHSLEAGHTYHIRLSTDEQVAGAYTFTLDVEHGITGVIRDTKANAARGVLVWAFDDDERKIAAACSSSKGTYRVSGLPRGTYRLRYEAGACDPNDDEPAPSSVPDGYVEWYEDADSFASATRVVVKAAGDTTDVDVVLGEEAAASPSTPTSQKPSPSPSVSPTPSASVSEVATIDPTSVAGRAPASQGGGWIGWTMAFAIVLVVAVWWFLRRRSQVS